LQVGEKVDLNVEVTNLGPGDSKEAVVTLKNLAGESVFLDRGREKLGNLKVGASKAARLKFSLREDVAADNAELRVSVWDSTLGASISQSLKVPVAPAKKIDSDNHMLKVSSKDDLPIFSGAAENASIIAYAKPGSLLKGDALIDAAWRRIEVQQGL